MPTALAIEGSLQYCNKESLAKQPSPPTEELPASEVSRGTSMQRFFYSPALYATPEPAPIPDVSSILYSPNIYIVNHKRRDSRSRSAVPNRVEGFENQQVADVSNGGDVIPLSGFLGKEEEGKKFDGWVGDVEIVEELKDDFNDPRDCVNVGTSESDVEDGDCQLSVKFRSQDEFYDTAEEYFSDASLSKSSPSLRRSSENELRLLKLCLIEESSKRKAAEENLLHLNKQHEDLLKCLHRSRSFSPDLLNLRNEIDPTEIWQQLVVLRSVFEALETDLAKAEVEEAFTEIIVAKNHEISRLRDRMMYYEAMNREMSQRKLETVDLARKRRLRRRRRWIWSCVGLSVTAGASLLAYSYLPPYNGSEIPSTSDPSSTVLCSFSGGFAPII